MTPTCGSPDRAAACARATANDRPALTGIDSSTTVNPFRAAGQAVSEPGADVGGEVVVGGGVVGAGGGVVAVGVPEGTVGSTVSVGGGVVGVCGWPPFVAVIVGPPLPFEAPSRMAPVAPATARIRPRSAGQIQSPG